MDGVEYVDVGSRVEIHADLCRRMLLKHILATS
jgi:hypothetical protein